MTRLSPANSLRCCQREHVYITLPLRALNPLLLFAPWCYLSGPLDRSNGRLVFRSKARSQKGWRDHRHAKYQGISHWRGHSGGTAATAVNSQANVGSAVDRELCAIESYCAPSGIAVATQTTQILSGWLGARSGKVRRLRDLALPLTPVTARCGRFRDQPRRQLVELSICCHCPHSGEDLHSRNAICGSCIPVPSLERDQCPWKRSVCAAKHAVNVPTSS